jgi:hypothetical protein
MLQSLVLSALALVATTEAFAPPHFEVRSSLLSTSSIRAPPKVLLWSAVDEPKVNIGGSTFDNIEDEGTDVDVSEQMVSEVSTFDNIKDEGTEITDVDASPPVMEEDAPLLPGVPSEEGIEKMLDRALAASVKSVQDKLPPELQDETSMNVMEDESLKEEIAQIFDKASNDLKAALDEIRVEQKAFAQKSSEKSAERAISATQVEKARMAQAEDSMVKMISRVNKESAEVERAVEELKEAQKDMSSDPVMKLASGSILKQASLAGLILFTLRSGIDTVAMLGGDASHAFPALLQGAIALACAAYFAFAK